MFPVNSYSTIESVEVEFASKTYKVDTFSKRICSKIDGLDAIVQSLNKLFETERFAYEIYTSNYGVEFQSLVGQNLSFIIAVLESRIRDAILVDDRILDLRNFSIRQIDVDSAEISMQIITVEGSVEFRKEIGI